MRVGLTYDLRQYYLERGFAEEEVAEFDSPRTVEAIAEAVAAAGHEAVLIGSLPQLVARLAAGERWDLVFNIAEGLGGFGREAQVPALLDYYGVPYTFSDPLVLALTLHKGMTKRVVRDLGLATPQFRVVESLEDARRVDLAFPLFAKPVAEGTGRGIDGASRIDNRDQLLEVCGQLLRTYDQPVLVESYLPGREFTVGILGTGEAARVLGVMEVVIEDCATQKDYTWFNKENCDGLVTYRLVEGPRALACGDLALAAWRGLGCRDAGRVDLREDPKGRPHFLEVNPLAGLHPEHSDLPIMCGLAGIAFQELIEGILSSALQRAGLVGSGLVACA